MKFLVLSVAGLVPIIVPQAVCQDNRLHLTRPFLAATIPGRVELTASSAQRDLSGPGSGSILHLTGNVEVRMITCGPGQGESFVCDKGSMVLHADTVDYNEKTGEIQASGNVHVVPYLASAKTTPYRKPPY